MRNGLLRLLPHTWSIFCELRSLESEIIPRKSKMKRKKVSPFFRSSSHFFLVNSILESLAQGGLASVLEQAQFSSALFAFFEFYSF